MATPERTLTAIPFMSRMKSLARLKMVPLALSAASWSEPSPDSEQVVFFSGGTIDDGLTFIVLTTMDEVNLQGVVVTNADCIANPAMELQWKISSYTQSTEIPVSLSDARVWNPFPWSYRDDCIRFSNVEALKSYGANPQWPPYPSGDELIEELLTRAIANDTPLTMLVTCPVTALSKVLAKNPKLAQGIERMIFMGGAIDVPGNLDPETIPKEIASSGGEWNIFWDPVSTEWIFNNTSFPIILFPLDVTNQAKLAPLVPRLRERFNSSLYCRHGGMNLSSGASSSKQKPRSPNWEEWGSSVHGPRRYISLSLEDSWGDPRIFFIIIAYHMKIKYIFSLLSSP